MKCSGCLKTCTNTNSLRCSIGSCDKVFCALCANANPSTLPADRKKCWKCPECCAAQKKGGDNTATPVRQACDEQHIALRKKEAPADCSQDIRDLVVEMRSLTQELQGLQDKLKTTTSSLNRCHERLDEMVNAQKILDDRLKHLEHRDQEFVLLTEKVRQLECSLNTQAQSQLRNEVEIIGIPETHNESLQHIVLIAARKIGVELSEQDVDWVHRAGSRRAVSTDNSFSRPVVVRLLRRGKRDQIIKASRSRRIITSKDLDVDGPVTKIFYNERLTRENRQLFREAREASVRLGYKFCWCHLGTIYMRRREGTTALPIRSKEDLQKIQQTSSPDGRNETPEEKIPIN